MRWATITRPRDRPTSWSGPTERELILTKLAQEKMIPKGIPGWKLFDMTKWTETERELDVKFMRSLRDEIKRHIESLENIEKADVDIAMTEDSIYSESRNPIYRGRDGPPQARVSISFHRRRSKASFTWFRGPWATGLSRKTLR